MSDTLVIGGTTYNGVTGIKASDSNDNTLVYIRPAGTKSIGANGNNIDVTDYAAVNVSVSPNLQSKSKSYTPTSTQQTETITADNGYDGLSSVAITVAAASGGSNWTLLHEEDIAANTTGTSAASLKSITGITGAWDDSKIIYVRVRDKAGPRAGYFYGSDSFFINWQKANGSTTAPTTAGRIIHRYTSSNTWGEYVGATTTGYGVYGYDINSSGRVRIYQRYSSSYSLTINGTYRVQIYSLTYPDGKSPFNTGTITGTI